MEDIPSPDAPIGYKRRISESVPVDNVGDQQAPTTKLWLFLSSDGKSPGLSPSLKDDREPSHFGFAPLVPDDGQPLRCSLKRPKFSPTADPQEFEDNAILGGGDVTRIQEKTGDGDISTVVSVVVGGTVNQSVDGVVLECVAAEKPATPVVLGPPSWGSAVELEDGRSRAVAGGSTKNGEGGKGSVVPPSLKIELIDGTAVIDILGSRNGLKKFVGKKSRKENIDGRKNMGVKKEETVDRKNKMGVKEDETVDGKNKMVAKKETDDVKNEVGIKKDGKKKVDVKVQKPKRRWANRKTVAGGAKNVPSLKESSTGWKKRGKKKRMDKTAGRKKTVYSREDMEALRYLNVEEGQRKMWQGVYGAFSADVKVEYDGLVRSFRRQSEQWKSTVKNMNRAPVLYHNGRGLLGVGVGSAAKVGGSSCPIPVYRAVTHC